MKLNKFFMGLLGLGALAMTACSSEEPVSGGDVDITGGDEKAYLSVKINSTEDFTRATDFNTDPDKGEYEFGSEAEHLVKSVKFFFFDAEGNFAELSAKLSNPELQDPEFGEPEGGQDNVEWISKKNVLVLEGLQTNKYPTYMLTVVNNEKFTAESTLQATAEKLAKYSTNFGVGNGKDVKNGQPLNPESFLMTTSSYVAGDKIDGSKPKGYYSVTELKEENFFQSAEDAVKAANVVDIYVERLAAKVQVGITATKNADGLYELEQTVGSGNEGNDNNDGVVPAPGVTANTKLYLKVIGWGLNAYAKDSYYSKKLDDNWQASTNNPFEGWNSAARYRSFWAKAFMYGADPSDKLGYIFTSNLPKGKFYTDGDATKAYAQYCYENTNTPDYILNLNGAITDRVTHVVVEGVVCDSEGNGIEMVKYNGVLYMIDAFKNYAFNRLNNSESLNYYKVTKTEESVESGTKITYSAEQITTASVSIVAESANNLENAKFIANDGVNEAEWWSRSVATGTEGNDAIVIEDAKDGKKYVYTKLAAGSINTVFLTDLNRIYNNSNPATALELYKGGYTKYYIPIEHFATKATEGKEGYYGVVRNHWYKVDINKFSKVGHAVNDPNNSTKEIIPQKTNEPLYYLGARINVLSWRIINQTVDL